MQIPTQRIQSQHHSYNVTHIASLEKLLQKLSYIKHPFIVVDQQIEESYPEFLRQLRTFSKVLTIDATEDTKNLAGCEIVLQFLQERNATKSSTLVAIGGGITQDIVSFAAHIYYRGLDLILVPTTLLAMSDSCIGGKCALNFFGFKNQLGAFHPPSKVLVWAGFTETLSDTALYSGYGEIFKSMLIGHSTLYQNFCRTVREKGFRNSPVAELSFQAREIKKKLIEEDEFDQGNRRILNYGHTFGHALERATDYQIPHGIAVVHGIDIANYISYQRGLLSENIFMDINHFIQHYFPKLVKHKLDPTTLMLNAQKDKKSTDGILNMILLKNFGEFDIESIPLDKDLEATLANYLRA